RKDFNKLVGAGSGVSGRRKKTVSAHALRRHFRPRVPIGAEDSVGAINHEFVTAALLLVIVVPGGRSSYCRNSSRCVIDSFLAGGLDFFVIKDYVIAHGNGLQLMLAHRNKNFH